MCDQPPTSHKLEVSYDFVAIVDFLPELDRETECTSYALEEFLKQAGYVTCLQKCNDKSDLIGTLRALAAESRKGKVFLIQLVGHGLTDGLVMPDTKLVLNWSVIAPAFREFDPEGLRQTILNMTTCWGLNGAKITNFLPMEKFFGILGPGKEMSFETGFEINSRFYLKLMAGVTVNEIIRQLQSELGEDVVFGITSHGYQHLRAKQLRGEPLDDR